MHWNESQFHISYRNDNGDLDPVLFIQSNMWNKLERHTMLKNGSQKLKQDAYAKWYLDKVVASPAASKHVLILALLYKYFNSFLAFIIDNVSFWLNTFTFYVNTISS